MGAYFILVEDKHAYHTSCIMLSFIILWHNYDEKLVRVMGHLASWMIVLVKFLVWHIVLYVVVWLESVMWHVMWPHSVTYYPNITINSLYIRPGTWGSSAYSEEEAERRKGIWWEGGREGGWELREGWREGVRAHQDSQASPEHRRYLWHWECLGQNKRVPCQETGSSPQTGSPPTEGAG